jgi:Zn-dependent protease
MPRTLKLARILGIRIGVSTSWFFVLFVMVFWLSGLFRQALGSDTEAYEVAVGSTLAYFGSLVLHELGHALAARREGIEIEGIDLWFFGGIARMSREADTPGAELRVALAGPAATLLVALVAGGAGILIAGPTRFFDVAALQRHASGDGGVVLLSWLSLMNLAILLFNLVPAYPLDGGRIARALAWRVTGDRNRATRASGRIGMGFAYMLGALGVLAFVDGTPATGLWCVLLAMILGQAARGAVMQSAVSERLEGVTVADIMDREPVTVSEDTSLLQAEDEYFMRYRWPWFAVVDAGGRFLGILRRERVEREIADGRPALPAGEALEPDGRWQIRTDATLQALLGSEALRRLGGVAAVDADGMLRGVVTVTDVRRALTPLAGGT